MKLFITNYFARQCTQLLSRVMMVVLLIAYTTAIYAQKISFKGASVKTAKSAGSARAASPLAPQTTFPCTDGVSYRLQDNSADNSELYQVNLRTGAATLLLNASSLGNRDLTGLGYNPLDNFLYASVSGTNDIVKIGITGVLSVIDVPNLPVDTYEAGDVSPDGILYLYSSGASTIKKVTLSSKAVSSISLNEGDNLQDISISPDGSSIYGIDADDGDLVRYAVSGGARTSTYIGLSSGTNSSYIDETGNLYIIQDASSSVFEIPGPGIPKAHSATKVTTSGTAIDHTDGARCIKSSATTQTSFVCTAGQAFVVVGTKGYKSDECNDLGSSKLAEYNLQNGTLTFETGQLINSFNSRTTLNNLGYNVKDGYLWAFRNGTNQLVRIGSEKTVDFFAISGLSDDCTFGSGVNNTVFTAGDINSNGVMYLLNSFNGDRFIRVDLNPASSTYLQKLGDVTLSGYDPSNTQKGVDDFGFNPIDNQLYGIDGNNHLIRFNPTTGAGTDIGNVSGLPNSNNYLSAFFDNAGTLYVQPSNSNDVYKIPYVATDNTPSAIKFIDNGASVGSNGDGARCPYSPVAPTYTISGTVFNDADGLVDGIVNGTAVSSLAGNTFSVNLVGPGGKVIATSTLTSGNFSFTGVSGSSSYSVVLSNTPGTPGNNPPSTVLTGSVVNTGEHIGDGAGSDGLINGIITVAVNASSVGDVNFGVERLPTADPKTAVVQANPGGTTTVVVPTLTGSDPEDGTYDGTVTDKNTIVIQSLPTNGTLSYNGTNVTTGQVITNYDFSKLKVDPADGPVSVTFIYSERDAAGKDSPAALVTMPFSSAPDLIPIIYARPSTVYNTTPVTVVVDVAEVLGIASSGEIRVRLTKQTKVSLSYDPVATTVGGRAVVNSNWTLDATNSSYYLLTSKTGVSVGAKKKLSFGFTGTLTPGATSGTLTLTSTIEGGSGGETRINNNADADKIDFFQQ